MKKIIEISPKYEKEYTMPDWLYKPFVNAFTRFKLIYPKTSLQEFYKNMDKVFKDEVTVKTLDKKYLINGSVIETMFIDEV